MPAKRKQPRIERTDSAANTEAAVDEESRHENGSGQAAQQRGETTAAAHSTCGPLNPIFALTGPRGGCLSARAGANMLAQLSDMVDDSVFAVLASAWECVSVPADQYWSCRSSQYDLSPSTGAFASKSSAAPAALRVPDPRHVQLSFYPTRLEAMAGFSYDSQRNMVVLAADKRGGSGSKIFTVLSRDSANASPLGVKEVTSEGDEESGVPHGDALAGVEAKQIGAGETLPSPAPSPPHACAASGASAVTSFVDAVPKLYERCLYVLVDEAAPVDPYFDVDCHFSVSDDRIDTKLPFWDDLTSIAACGADEDRIEDLLASILERLATHVESFFGTKVESCLVLTSTVQQRQQHYHTHDVSDSTGGRVSRGALRDLKLSFHVHFRLHNREAVASVRDLHQCLSRLREQLDTRLKTLAETADHDRTAADQKEWRALQAVRQCVDFGVYTRWRAFRLPYNVKSPLDRDGAFTAVDAAADDLLESQVAQSGVLAPGEDLPRVAVGHIASHLVTNLYLSADATQRTTQQALLKKMMYRFRALLPVMSGVTSMRADGALKAFLDAHPLHVVTHEKTSSGGDATRAFASTVFDLALIQRDHTPRAPLQLLHAPAHTGAEAGAGVNAGGAATANPFRVPRPVFPRSVRQTVHDVRRKELIAEIFRCLSPRYAGTVAQNEARQCRPAVVDSFDQVEPNAASTASGNALRDARPITADGLSVQYEESIRAYYATQKQNKYCLRQNRLHKATYAQLYLTYGSIKVRCYANDCCERCLYIPWSGPRAGTAEGAGAASTALGLPAVEGFPQYARLQAIHEELFPPLPLDEIVRRYGTEAAVSPP